MADFVNTIDLLGDEAVTKAIVERTITEFNDDVITTVGQYAFCKCIDLASVNLPNVGRCNSYCFAHCTALTDVNLPRLTGEGTNIFQNCTALKSISLPSLSGSYTGMFKNCTSLENVNLPIAGSLWIEFFSGCTSLRILDLPKVKRINTSVFSNCSKLYTLFLRTERLCTLSGTNAFSGTPFAKNGTGGTLIVPRSLTTEYPTATNWSSIMSGNANNRILALEDYTVDGTITGEIDWEKLGGTT